MKTLENFKKLSLFNWYEENNIDKDSYIKGYEQGHIDCLKDVKKLFNEFVDKNIELFHDTYEH